MTAKEMFKQLGFERKENEDYIEFIEDECGTSVVFEKFAKDFYCNYIYEPLRIDMDLLKAINQQCKELGWL